MSTMSAINKSEYLKRYLSKGKKEKKHKKVPRGIKQNRVKIIDDTCDIQEQVQTIQDIATNDEDAPQVVAVIDDRPMELRMNSFKDTSNWAIVDIKPAIKQESHSPPPTTRNHNRWNKPGKDSTHDDYNPLKRSENDSSPPRGKRTNSPKHVEVKARSVSPQQRRNDGGESPLRRPNQTKHRNDNDDDNSPPRRRKRAHENNKSFTRRRRQDSSPPRRRENSSEGRSKSETSSKGNRKTRWPSASPEPTISKKSQTTLDGKTTGLQNAADLVKEKQAHKEREARQFKEMPAEISGVNASTVLRDRKTGMIRDLELEATEKFAEMERTNELQKKYDQWGKGVKQTADYRQKLQNTVYEMSKPLARYADNEDLERHLKEQERDGDPMLAYIKRKKQEVAITAGIKSKPQYLGEFMLNRYGIRPGHRWDGVDRSNGYEKKWFGAVNKRRADIEEARRWNCEDM